MESLIYNDHLTGGNGNDTFRFYVNSYSDDVAGNAVITDFSGGQDSIDLSHYLDAGRFTFIGDQDFSNIHARNQLRFDAVNHQLLGSTDADNAAEFTITLLGVNTLSATDLVL